MFYSIKNSLAIHKCRMYLLLMESVQVGMIIIKYLY